MAKQEKSSMLGFKIKLSQETVQKLAEEDQARSNSDRMNTISATLMAEEPKKSESKFVSNTSDNGNKCTTDSIAPNNPISSNKEAQKSDDNQDNKAEEPFKTHSDTTSESWGDYAPYVSYNGDEAIYTDPTTQQKYTWNHRSNTWDPKSGDVPGRVYSYENNTHIYTEPDGSKSFWDDDKKAWIPKVDDDFLAYYQMSYGFVDNTTQEVEIKIDTKEKKEEKKDPTAIKRKNEPQWFEPSSETNTKVYVSNLPLDMTEEEFVNFMQKCGLVERDPSTQKMKVKLYMDKEHNCFKGDALCTYIKIESVDLALKLLDGYDLQGHKVKVERAHFQLKGEYNPALKPKKKKKKELEKIKKMQQKLFDWRPEKILGERAKHERVVIVKNLFHPSDFDKEVQLILDYQQDLREECSKSGEVRKVVLYDRHPEGVAQITMKEPEQADAVVQLINGRWFGKRQIIAEIWDGRTKYRIAETDADLNKRAEKWDKFLEGKEDTKVENKDSVLSKEKIDDSSTDINAEVKIDENTNT